MSNPRRTNPLEPRSGPSQIDNSGPALLVIRGELDSAVNSNRREQELDRLAGTAQAPTIAVPLGKIVPLLIDAGQQQRAWLDDFADDLVRIDTDLYDVLLAYQEMRGRAAA